MGETRYVYFRLHHYPLIEYSGADLYNVVSSWTLLLDKGEILDLVLFEMSDHSFLMGVHISLCIKAIIKMKQAIDSVFSGKMFCLFF